jgi:transposase InsO family protein
MRDVAVIFVHLICTLVRLLHPGGLREVVAESLLVKHQLLVLNRPRQRAPQLRPTDRVIAGPCALLMRPSRVLKSAIVLRPSTIMGFHRALVKRKYRLLFTPHRGRKPGPKGPTPEMIAAILEMKQRNPRFGYQRIAHQLALVLDIKIDKDVVRRILAKHYRPDPRRRGPSWLTFLGHTKDSLWSVDFFRCESLGLRSHWVMVVMDRFTRNIVGFAVHAGVLDGPTICRMFGRVIARADALPQSLSSDNDPLFEFHRWKANLRVLDVGEIKTVPHVPLSHPFIERLIGTIRRELLDHAPFWTGTDLQRKLDDFKQYYNQARTHRSLGGKTPVNSQNPVARIDSLKWNSYCRGLYQLPVAA